MTSKWHQPWNFCDWQLQFTVLYLPVYSVLVLYAGGFRRVLGCLWTRRSCGNILFRRMRTTQRTSCVNSSRVLRRWCPRNSAVLSSTRLPICSASLKYTRSLLSVCISLSVCLSVCLCICLSVYVSVFLSACWCISYVLSPVYTIQPVLKPVVNRLDVCLHDAASCIV